MALRDAGYRTGRRSASGASARPGTTGQPDKKGFEYAFGFLDHRHAHRQFTDHLYRNGEPVADRRRPRLRERPVHAARPPPSSSADDPRPFFLYLNYTVPHAELRVPEDSLAPMRGNFPETPFVNAAADAQAHRARTTCRSGTGRSRHRKAAFAAMIVRMDRDIGRADGSASTRADWIGGRS